MNKTKRIVISALLTALSLALFSLELIIPPFPFCPGAKIGLANIVTLYMLTNENFFKKMDVFCVLTARCILAAVITGRLTSVFFSFFGGLSAFAAMLVIRRILGEKYAICISVTGAVFHNFTQIIVSILIYGTYSAFYLLPSLFVAGVACGILTGLCVEFINKLNVHNKFL